MVSEGHSTDVVYPGRTHLQSGFVSNHRVLYVMHSPRQGALSCMSSLPSSAKAAEFSKSATPVTSFASLRIPSGNWNGNLAQIFFTVAFRAHNPRHGALS